MSRYLFIPPSILSGETGIDRNKSERIPTENVDLALFKKNTDYYYAVVPCGVQIIQLLNKLAQHDYQIIFNEVSIGKQHSFLEILHNSCSRIKLSSPKVHAIVGSEAYFSGDKKIWSSQPEITKNDMAGVPYSRITYHHSTKDHEKFSAAREAVSVAFGTENEWVPANHVVFHCNSEVIASAQQEGYQVVKIPSDNIYLELVNQLDFLYTQSLTDEAKATILNDRFDENSYNALIEKFVALKKDFDVVEDITKANYCKKATDDFIQSALSAKTLKDAEYAKNAYYNQLVKFSISQKLLVGAITFAGLVLGLLGGIYLLGNIAIGAWKEGGIEARFSSILSKIGMFKLDSTQNKTDVFSKTLVEKLNKKIAKQN